MNFLLPLLWLLLQMLLLKRLGLDTGERLLLVHVEEAEEKLEVAEGNAADAVEEAEEQAIEVVEEAEDRAAELVKKLLMLYLK